MVYNVYFIVIPGTINSILGGMLLSYKVDSTLKEISSSFFNKIGDFVNNLLDKR